MGVFSERTWEALSPTPETKELQNWLSCDKSLHAAGADQVELAHICIKWLLGVITVRDNRNCAFEFLFVIMPKCPSWLYLRCWTRRLQKTPESHWHEGVLAWTIWIKQYKNPIKTPLLALNFHGARDCVLWWWFLPRSAEGTRGLDTLGTSCHFGKLGLSNPNNSGLFIKAYLHGEERISPLDRVNQLYSRAGIASIPKPEAVGWGAESTEMVCTGYWRRDL